MNGVLVERTVADVLPALKENVSKVSTLGSVFLQVDLVFKIS